MHANYILYLLAAKLPIHNAVQHFLVNTKKIYHTVILIFWVLSFTQSLLIIASIKMI